MREDRVEVWVGEVGEVHSGGGGRRDRFIYRTG